MYNIYYTFFYFIEDFGYRLVLYIPYKLNKSVFFNFLILFKKSTGNNPCNDDFFHQ